MSSCAPPSAARSQAGIARGLGRSAHAKLTPRSLRIVICRNASFSTLCTLTRADVGAVLAHEASRAALGDIMHEVLAVARASLVPSPAVEEVLADTVVNEIISQENPESVFRPSMLVDLDCGRPMEVEAIVGGVLKRARTHGVPTPKLDLVYAGLSVIQGGLLKKP